MVFPEPVGPITLKMHVSGTANEELPIYAHYVPYLHAREGCYFFAIPALFGRPLYSYGIDRVFWKPYNGCFDVTRKKRGKFDRILVTDIIATVESFQNVLADRYV